MRTSIKIRAWSGIDGTRHVATSYRIATDQAMTNIVDESINNTTALTLYNSNIVIPVNETYYVSIKRHLVSADNLPIVSEWTLPKPVKNYPEQSGLMVVDDIVVDKPFIYVDMVEVKDTTKDTFLVKTSAFRSNSEGHAYTHLFIYDDLGNLIYDKMNVTENKTAIVVDKIVMGLSSHSKFVIKVIHGTASSVESGVGSKIITMLSSNIVINSRVKDIVPFTDYTLKLSTVDSTKPANLKAIDVMTLDETETVWSANIVPNVLEYIIPYRILGANSKYILRVTTTNGTNKVYLKKVMSTIEALGEFRKILDYKYNNELDYLTDVNGPILSKNTSYTMLNTGKVIAKDPAGTGFTLWDVDINSHVFNNPVSIPGLNTLTSSVADVYVTVREDGLILIDCLNSLDVPTFLVYKYDTFRNTAVLLNTKVRSTETKCLGYNNGVVRYDENTYYYIPVGGNTINKLDISTCDISAAYTIDNTSTNNLLTKFEQGKLSIITGGFDILSYDVETSDVYNILTLPIKFRNRDLKVVNLVNNDILVTLKEILADDTEFMLSFDSSIGMLRPVTKKYTGGDINYDTSILLSNGELLLIANTDTRDKYYIYS